MALIARSQSSGRSSSSIKCITSDEEDDEVNKPTHRGFYSGFLNALYIDYSAHS